MGDWREREGGREREGEGGRERGEASKAPGTIFSFSSASSFLLSLFFSFAAESFSLMNIFSYSFNKAESLWDAVN